MKQVKSILCPLDLSEASIKAYKFGKYLADQMDATLWILHVVPESPEFYSTMFPELADLVGGIHSELEEKIDRIIDVEASNVKRVVLSGKPAEEILKFQEHKATDMIVMGARGVSQIERLLLGSTADRVLRRATCPVLIVHGQFHTPKIRRILVPTDFGEFSAHALGQAIDLARHMQAEIDLFHVMEVHTYDSRKISEFLEGAEGKKVEDELRNSMTIPEGGEDVVIHKVIQRGFDPASEILNYAAEESVDLIAMATHGRRGISRLILGSVTEKVIHYSPCSVLTIRHPKYSD